MNRAFVRKALQFVVGIGLAVFLLWWGLPRIAHTTWTDVWATLSGLQASTVVGLTILMISGLWLVTFLYTGSLKGLSHGQAMIVNACGSSIGNLLPGGGAAGVVVTYHQLRSWGFLRRDISTMVIVTGVWNVLARVVLPVVGILAILIGIGQLNPVVAQAAIIGALIGLAVIVAFWGVLASEDFAHKLGRQSTRVWRRIRRKKAADTDFEKTLVGMRHDIIEIVRYGWLEMTYGLVGFFGVYYILFWFCLNSMGVQMPFAYMFGAYTVGRLLTAVGITPGGLGGARLPRRRPPVSCSSRSTRTSSRCPSACSAGRCGGPARSGSPRTRPTTRPARTRTPSMSGWEAGSSRSTAARGPDGSSAQAFRHYR